MTHGKVATYDSNSVIVTEVIFDIGVYIKSAIDDYVGFRIPRTA